MFNSHDRGTVNMKWIHGFPSGYVLDNVLKMDASEVSFWLNEYKEFTMKKVVHQTYTSAWTQDRNLISNANVNTVYSICRFQWLSGLLK